jgi:hypothetical protein
MVVVVVLASGNVALPFLTIALISIAAFHRVVGAYLNTNDRAAIRYMAGQPGR